MGAPHPLIGEDLCQVLRGVKQDQALGPCGWAVSGLRAFPPEAFDALVRCYTSGGAAGDWPHDIEPSFVSPSPAQVLARGPSPSPFCITRCGPRRGAAWGPRTTLSTRLGGALLSWGRKGARPGLPLSDGSVSGEVSGRRGHRPRHVASFFADVDDSRAAAELLHECFSPWARARILEQ